VTVLSESLFFLLLVCVLADWEQGDGYLDGKELGMCEGGNREVCG